MEDFENIQHFEVDNMAVEEDYIAVELETVHLNIVFVKKKDYSDQNN